MTVTRMDHVRTYERFACIVYRLCNVWMGVTLLEYCPCSYWSVHVTLRSLLPAVSGWVISFSCLKPDQILPEGSSQSRNLQLRRTQAVITVSMWVHHSILLWTNSIRCIISLTFLPQGSVSALSVKFICNTVNKKKNSMVWVRERTIPTERPPLVGEVIANFCG
jgi:hypothetical protein